MHYFDYTLYTHEKPLVTSGRVGVTMPERKLTRTKGIFLDGDKRAVTNCKVGDCKSQDLANHITELEDVLLWK